MSGSVRTVPVPVVDQAGVVVTSGSLAGLSEVAVLSTGLIVVMFGHVVTTPRVYSIFFPEILIFPQPASIFPHTHGQHTLQPLLTS